MPDVGRFEVTGREVDRYAFRVPTLRNVALTFPYMHDGSLATMRDVIDFYDGGNGDDPQRDSHLRKLNLSEKQKQQIVAFLESLTSANADNIGQTSACAHLRTLTRRLCSSAILMPYQQKFSNGDSQWQEKN